MNKVIVIGGGLAGCECAYQLLKRGHRVELYEMRPDKQTAVHKTGLLAELVCSNSLKSRDINTAQGLLKNELSQLDSLILRVAERTSVPAGGALAVDRKEFSHEVERALSEYNELKVIRKEITEIPDNDGYTVVATGPLTEGKFAESIKTLTGNNELYFYDAVAPVITAESVDNEKSFFAGRYGKGGDDYLNCPMNEEEYVLFQEELKNAETVILKDFEKHEVFNACMPIELMAKRGKDCMRFGPLRPVGIKDPETGKRPYAVVQLRKDDNYNSMYNIVGFQTNLKFGEQERVFRMIPALADAEFVRYGVLHRNTFLNAPKTLNADFSYINNEKIYFAGQISGVEGYLESTMSGLMSAINIDRELRGKDKVIPSEYTAVGSLMRYIALPNVNFQPMHVSYSLMPELEEKIKDKKLKKEKYSQRAVEAMKQFVERISKE